MTLTGAIALANIALAWLHTVLQMQMIGDLLPSEYFRWSSGNEYIGLWQLISWISQGSIAYFSLVFCAKLAVAVLQRRRLGIRQFGAMEIVLIMALQTMLVPGKSMVFDMLPLFSISPFHFSSVPRLTRLFPVGQES